MESTATASASGTALCYPTNIDLARSRVRQEAALLASVLRLLGALPSRPTPEMVRSLPSLGRGELLCHAYCVYRGLIPEGLISFEHAVFLLTALVRADELLLSNCRDCCAALIIDRWSLRAPRCALCAADHTGSAQAEGNLTGHLRVPAE